MRPKKKVLIYHPNERQADLYRYAMAVTLGQIVTVAATLKALKRRQDCDVTVLWKVKDIEIRNPQADTFRTLPVEASNFELMEAVHVGLARKRGPRKA